MGRPLAFDLHGGTHTAMRSFLLCVVLALAIACAAAQQTRPKLSETFESKGFVQIKHNGTLFFGEGWYHVSQPDGKALEAYAFGGAEHLNVYELQRFDKGKAFEIRCPSSGIGLRRPTTSATSPPTAPSSISGATRPPASPSRSPCPSATPTSSPTSAASPPETSSPTTTSSGRLISPTAPGSRSPGSATSAPSNLNGRNNGSALHVCQDIVSSKK